MLIGEYLLPDGKRTRPYFKSGFFLWIFGLSFSLGMLLIEPFLERDPPLNLLGDLLTARQYLRVCPLAEFAYFFEGWRALPISLCAMAGGILLALSLWPIIFRAQWNLYYRAGVLILAISISVLAVEFFLKEFWHLGPLQVRYAALAAAGLGAALAVRNRGYLCAMALAAFVWDISSAIFWAGLHGPLARLPVPYWGRLTSQVSGPPALVPIVVDTLLFLVFAAFWKSSLDPLKIFRD